MTDDLAQLHNDINDLKQKLMSYMNPDESFSDSEMDKYNAHTVVQQAKNYIKENKRSLTSNVDYHYFTNQIGELQADYSSLMTAQRNPTKVTYHAARKIMHIIEVMAQHDDSPTADEVTKLLRFRKRHENDNDTDSDSDIYEDPDDKSKNPYWEITPRFKRYVKDLWDQNKYNYNIWQRDTDTFEDPNSSWTMAHNVLNWLGYHDQVNDFINKYGRMQPNYQAYQYGGDTFYFPPEMTRNETPADLAKLVHDGYYGNLNKQITASRLTNNLYRKMWHSLYTGDFKDAQSSVGDKYLINLNNHPTDDLPAEQGMCKAVTNYRYKLQKDRIWEQYHQNQLNYMRDYSKKLQNEINKLSGTTKHHEYTYNGKSRDSHGRPYYSYEDFPNTPHGKAVKREITHLRHLIDNRMEGSSLLSKAQIQDKINKLSGTTKSHLYTYHGKAYNDYHEFPKTKHGKWVIKQIEQLVYDKSHYSFDGSFYSQEVAWRDKWKRAADKLQSQFKNERKRDLLKAYLTATTDNLKSDSRYGHFGYIRPCNPETEDSYVFMMITEESPTHTTEATTSPVEWGRNITTGTQKQPTEIEVSGYLFNHDLPHGDGYHEQSNDSGTNSEPSPSAPGYLNGNDTLEPVIKDDQALSNWQDDGAEMFYSGTHEYPHCIITSWNPDYNTGSDGNITACSFSMELQVVDYFMSNTDQKSGSKHGKSNNKGNLGTKKGKASSKKNRSHHVIAKAGYTYARVALKKHVSISTVMKKNKYPATDIPIGAKIYY